MIFSHNKTDSLIESIAAQSTHSLHSMENFSPFKPKKNDEHVVKLKSKKTNHEQLCQSFNTFEHCFPFDQFTYAQPTQCNVQKDVCCVMNTVWDENEAFNTHLARCLQQPHPSNFQTDTLTNNRTKRPFYFERKRETFFSRFLLFMCFCRF